MKIEVYYINGTTETIEIEDGDAIEPDGTVLNLWGSRPEKKRYCIPYCSILKWIELWDEEK